MARYVWLAILQDEVRLPLSKVEKHLGKVAVRPREPWPRIGLVVYGDRLMNQAETRGVLRVTQWSVSIRAVHVFSALTFAIRYREFKISPSSSVPKTAEIWDMGHG